MLPLMAACIPGNRRNASAPEAQPDSLYIQGEASEALLQAADSLELTVYPLAAPLEAAQSRKQGDYRFSFPVSREGRFAEAVPQDCPTLCVVSFGDRNDSALSATGIFFLRPGDTLQIQAQYDDGRLRAQYLGAKPCMPSADLGRAQDFFFRHINSFSGYSLPSERDQLLQRLDSLHRERIRLRLTVEADIFLQLQLNTSALACLAAARDVPDGYFSFLKYMDLGNPLVYSTHNYLPAFRNLLLNPYFSLPRPEGRKPEKWQQRAQKVLSPFIQTRDPAFYPRLYRIACLEESPGGPTR